MNALVHMLEHRIRDALGDREIRALAPGLTLRLRCKVGADHVDVQFADGVPSIDLSHGKPDVVIEGGVEAWAQVLASPPPPTFHAFTALALANPSLSIDGDPLRIAQGRAALERLFEMVCATAPAPAGAVARDMTAIAGRYAPVMVDGTRYDLYVETAGSGVPVLFLHTAGADSRQYAGQLSDLELGRSFRMLAPDLPFHGRTLPPLDFDGGAYALTTETYLRWVSAAIEQVAGEPVILVGCSMGAAMALTVAAERPDLLRGIVAVEPPLRSKGRRNPYQMHVAVHGGLHNAAYVRGLMSPLSPLAHRRRAAWIYAQGAPGIYCGDLAFYSDEFDAAAVAPRIDSTRVPVALLCGAYDYSATPADGFQIASLIAGTFYQEMPALGHFPMTEHPDAFRGHLLDALSFLCSRMPGRASGQGG